jgi:TusA-related sulfurtransferase
MNNELNYTLKKSIQCQIQGENLDCNNLVCHAPTYNVRRQCQKIKQIFFEIIKSNQEKLDKKKEGSETKVKTDDNDSKIEASDILNLFYTSDIDISKAMDEFENLITSGLCKVEGQIQLNKNLLNKMALQDIENLFGEYVAFFLIES